MIRRTTKLIALVLLLVMIISICGVCATWKFAMDGATFTSDSSELGVDINDFNFSNENKVITAIVEDLNSNSSEVQENLDLRFLGEKGLIFYHGTHSFWGTNDPSFKLDGTSDLSKLIVENNYTILVRADDGWSSDSHTTMWIYLTDVDLGDQYNPSIPIGEYIYRVYRFTLTRSGTNANNMTDWELTASQLGYAPLCYYLDQETNGYNQDDQQIPSIDMVNWTEGILGYSTGTFTDTHSNRNYDGEIAVRTFAGDKPTAFNDLYDDNFDLEKSNNSSYYNGDFYYLLEIAGNTYYYAYNDSWTYYGASTSAPSGTTYSRYGETLTYNYNSAGSYTISTEKSGVTITVLDSSGTALSDYDTNYTNGTSSVTFTASGSTKYYIKVSCGGSTTQISVTYND